MLMNILFLYYEYFFPLNVLLIFFQGIVDSSAQKLVTLANQWEKHRVPLIEQYRELKELNSKKEVRGHLRSFKPINIYYQLRE